VPPFPASARRLPREVRRYWHALAPKLVRTGWLDDPLLRFGLTTFCTMYWAYRMDCRLRRDGPRDSAARAMATETRRMVRKMARDLYLI
jgi:hypothetical protein